MTFYLIDIERTFKKKLSLAAFRVGNSETAVRKALYESAIGVCAGKCIKATECQFIVKCDFFRKLLRIIHYYSLLLSLLF